MKLIQYTKPYEIKCVEKTTALLKLFKLSHTQQAWQDKQKQRRLM